MIKHVVMVKAKETLPEAEKKVLIKKFSRALESLPGKIDVIRELEVGLNISTRASAFDLVLTAVFDNEASLAFYREHPGHTEALAILSELAGHTAVVDYYISSSS